MYHTRHGQDDTTSTTPIDHVPTVLSSQTTIRTSRDSIPIDDMTSLATVSDDVDNTGTMLPSNARKSIMTYSSPGEAIVYRDMADLQRREAELRRRWREMGFELFPVDDNWLIDDETVGVIEAQGTAKHRSNHRMGRSPNETCESMAHAKNQTSDFRNRENGNEIRRKASLTAGATSFDVPTEVESRSEAVEDGVRRGLFESISDQQVIISGRSSENVSIEDGSDVDDSIQHRSRDLWSTGQLQRGRTKGRSSRDDAERRIENEVAEIKKREAELRCVSIDVLSVHHSVCYTTSK